MRSKDPKVGARKAGKQLALARKHYAEMYAIIIEYDILSHQIDKVDCVCDLSEIEQELLEIESVREAHP